MSRPQCWALALVLVLLAAPYAGAEKKPLELVDLMKLRTIQDPVISEDGAWVAYALVPDRGDGEAVVQSADGRVERRLERGSHPVLSADGAWLAARLEPPLEEREKAAGKKAKKGKRSKKGKVKEEAEEPKAGLGLLSTAAGTVVRIERVESFAFSVDGRWLAYRRFKDEAEEAAEGGDGEARESVEAPAAAAPPREPAAGEPGGEQPPEREVLPALMPPSEPGGEEPPTGEDVEEAEIPEEELGSPLVLRRLATGEEVEVPGVTAYAFAPNAPYLAYAVSAPDGEANGLYLRTLNGESAPERALHREEQGRYGALAWAEEAPSLAFVAWTAEENRRWEPAPAVLWAWDGDAEAEARRIAGPEDAPEGWYVPAANQLSWTRDAERLFFGFKPLEERREKEQEGDDGGEAEAGEAPEKPFDPYDPEAILEGREVDVWHGDDPLIIPHQKRRWEEEAKRVYPAVYHAASRAVVPLADLTMREIRPSQSPRAALGLADVPYLKEITWDDRYRDVYRVDLRDGSRALVANHLRDEVSLSPEGRYAVYYRSPHWYLFDGETGETRNLTESLPVAFSDEDHDYPATPPGYGVADWVEGDRAVLIYDKFDLWRFPAAGGEALRVTAGEGRRRRIRFRLLDLAPERDFLRGGEELLLAAYHDREKSWGFYRAREGEEGVEALVEEEKKLTFVARAEKAPRLLYTRESYTEFPDLWLAGLDLAGRRKLSRANPELDRHAWGSAELVEWESADGEPLQGVLIKPAGYRSGQRYPVIVYFYRFFSPRLYEFNEPVVNHRPSFPVYAGRGYALFLPDIRFEVGRPGLAAVKALVSGVQKLVDMGVADPEHVGLHGHSWSGYQTAFVITQTHLFAAAVAGAPVANMTSAYGGIRWGSGLARQFQYEQGQSRLGKSPWEARDRYIENSPVFYADRIATPLLIQFGDEDGAVPWTQGIELYLALRRLGKEVIFLQYRGEDHHLKKYANKLDYSIKMLEFFDHYLKGAPAPAWMIEGVPYRGE